MRNLAYPLSVLREIIESSNRPTEYAQSVVGQWYSDHKLRKIRIRRGEEPTIILGELIEYLKNVHEKKEISSSTKSQSEPDFPLSEVQILAALFQMEGRAQVNFVGFNEESQTFIEQYFKRFNEEKIWEITFFETGEELLSDVDGGVPVDCLVIDSSIRRTAAMNLIQGLKESTKHEEIPIFLFHDPADQNFYDAKGFLTFDKGLGLEMLLGPVIDYTEVWCEKRPIFLKRGNIKGVNPPADDEENESDDQ